MATNLADCPPGLFLFGAHLGFKSEYRTVNSAGFAQTDAYVVASGEYFWGGAPTAEAREELLVQPLEHDEVLARLPLGYNEALGRLALQDEEGR